MSRAPMPGERLVRVLLLLHPRAFRRRHGDEIVNHLREAWRDEAKGRGASAALSFWWRRVGGTVVAAARQRLARVRRPSARPHDQGSTAMLLDELKQALRTLRAAPGFVAVTVAILAVGMGANTAVYTVFHDVLLAPLPWEQGERLARIYHQPIQNPEIQSYLPGLVVTDVRENTRSLEGLAIAYTYDEEGVDLTDGDRPERLRRLRVSADYAQVLGVQLVLGRSFERSEERPEARVVMVSEDVWRRYLDGSRDAVGRGLTLDGEAHTVVGVVPDGFRDPIVGRVDIWTPQDLTPGGYNSWGNHYLSAVARLAPGVSVEEAREELAILAQRQREANARLGDFTLQAVPLHEDVVGASEPLLLLLMGAVALLLVLTAVNVAGLLLVRTAGRTRELAVRSALGSGRGRLVRQLLLESGLLALAGAAAGLALGLAVLAGLDAVAPAGLPRQENVGLGVEALLFGGAMSVLVAGLLGLLPAWQLVRGKLALDLRDGGRGGERRSQRRARGVMVASQVGLAAVLLAGAGVLLRSYDGLRRVDLGMDPTDVMTFQISLPDSRYDAEARAGFHPRFQERLEALPSVEHAGAISWLPVTGSGYSWGTRRASEAGDDDAWRSVDQRVVEGAYFDAVGAELIRGRLFGPEDSFGTPMRLVVNEALVQVFFPDEDPVGGRLSVAGDDGEVIGVVNDVAVDPRGGVRPKIYHSHSQFAGDRNWSLTQVVRLRSGPAASAGFMQSARGELSALDPLLVLHSPVPLAEVAGRGIEAERFALIVLGAFAAVALLLAALGLYGTLAYWVSRRTREIGVRLALGAGRAAVRKMVVGQGLGLAVVGAFLGLLAALGLTRLLSSWLYDVGPRDPAVFLGVPVLLVVVAAVASWLPAVRATRIDPVEAFKGE